MCDTLTQHTLSLFTSTDNTKPISGSARGIYYPNTFLHPLISKLNNRWGLRISMNIKMYKIDENFFYFLKSCRTILNYRASTLNHK